jgi:site-specific DNA-methyltransferase (adenine-specific)
MLTITNEDNMLLMARYPDKYFDLAIVDPPYGLGNKLTQGGTWSKKWQTKGSDWDKLPNKEYFN